MRHPLSRSVRLMALALAATAWIAGCGQKPADSYRIGAILPLSGDLAAYGQSTLDGVRLMAEKINAEGGIDGRPIELLVENNEGDKTKTSNALLKLAGLKKVLAVIGPITSTNAMAVAPDAEKKGLVLVTPTATNDDVTGLGKFIFRACFNDSFQGIAVAKYAFTDLKIKTAVAFQDTNSDYSVGLCKSFGATFESLGGKMLPIVSYKKGDIEFTPQLRKIRESGAEAIFIPGYPPELPLIINESRSLGLQAILLGADGWDNDDVLTNAGENLVGTYFAAAFSPQGAQPELQTFLKLARDKGIENPGSFEALGYDSLGMVAHALAQAGGAALIASDLAQSRAAIQKALVALQDFQGATGSITMQPSGDPLKSLVVLKYDKIEGKVGKAFVKVVNP